jgi:hypothetical protein
MGTDASTRTPPVIVPDEAVLDRLSISDENDAAASSPGHPTYPRCEGETSGSRTRRQR